MAKIQTVDYEQMARQAKAMRTNGVGFNTEVTNAYNSIGEMHSVWYGIRYNELVKAFNEMTNSLNEMLNLVVGEIPFTMETIANNYSQADKGANVTSAVKEAPKKISNLPISNDVGMRFVTESVSTTQNNVSNNFKKAKELMNAIETEYEKITWQSEASEAFKAKFKKLKSEIVTAFDNIDSDFTKLMNQTKEDIQSAENANTL